MLNKKRVASQYKPAFVIQSQFNHCIVEGSTPHPPSRQEDVWVNSCNNDDKKPYYTYQKNNTANKNIFDNEMYTIY